MSVNKFTSKEQYRSIVSVVKERGCRLTNCFFLPTELDNKIQEGILLYEDIDTGILLLEDRWSFYRCYFFLDSSETPKPIVLDKDAVVEIPFNVAPNEGQQLQIRKVESMGFKLGRNSGMMSCLPEEIVKLRLPLDCLSLCQFAEVQDATQILEMLTETFNPLYSFLPSEKELLLAIEGGFVFVLKKDNEVIGTLVSSLKKNVASIKQLVIKQKYRGFGLGNILLNKYHNHYSATAKYFQHWVDLNNSSAISMYKKYGYRFAVKKAKEYVLISGGYEK